MSGDKELYTFSIRYKSGEAQSFGGTYSQEEMKGVAVALARTPKASWIAVWRGREIEARNNVYEILVSSYAPGPWRYGGDIYIYGADDRFIVARPEMILGNKPDGWHRTARLIAAAPELFETLEACIAHLDARLPWWRRWSRRGRATAATIAAARQVLSKAIGEPELQVYDYAAHPEALECLKTEGEG